MWAYRELLATLAYLCQGKLFHVQKKNVLSLLQSPQMPPVSLKPLDKLLCNPTLSPPTPKTLNDLLEDIEILLELLRGCVELPQKYKYL